MRKCIDLDNQPGFQNIYSPEMQQAIDRGLSQAQDEGIKGFSGTGVVNWGYDPEEVVKARPRIKDKSTKPRRKRKDFARTQDETTLANEVRRGFFNVEETANPKGIIAEQVIRTSNVRGMNILNSVLKTNPLNAIQWHGSKSKSSFFGRTTDRASGVEKSMLSMKRGDESYTSQTARHELGHYIDYVLGMVLSPLDNREGTRKGNSNFFLSDLHSDFESAFNYEVKRLKLDSRDGRREYIDKVIKDYIVPTQKLSKNRVIKSFSKVLSNTGGMTDIVDAMTGGSWSLRGYGGGHSGSYYSLKSGDYHGNSRLHETFANLFEAWSAKDKDSWERLEDMFPMLTEVFDNTMREYIGIMDTQLNKEL